MAKEKSPTTEWAEFNDGYFRCDSVVAVFKGGADGAAYRLVLVSGTDIPLTSQQFEAAKGALSLQKEPLDLDQLSPAQPTPEDADAERQRQEQEYLMTNDDTWTPVN